MNYPNVVRLRLLVTYRHSPKGKNKLGVEDMLLFLKKLILTTRLLDVHFKNRNWKLMGLQWGKNLLLQVSH